MSGDTIVDGRADESQQSGGVLEALLLIASRAQFFRSADGRFHAQVPIGDRHEIYGLKSTAFCDWLIESYRCERGELPPAGAVRSVVTSLVARARFDCGMPAVHVRSGPGRRIGRRGFLGGPGRPERPGGEDQRAGMACRRQTGGEIPAA